MQLGHRLLLVGAFVPAALLLLALLAGGLTMDSVLHRQIDRALLAQVAVEAVSLFDRVESPHLHLTDSPLDSQVREFAPRGALYREDGQLVMRYPSTANVPSSLDPRAMSTEAVLRTEDVDGTPHRIATMRVNAPDGAPHGLWLAASLDTHDSAVRLYWQFTGVSVGLVTVLLIVVQTGHARQLQQRVSAIAQHMQRIRSGDLDSVPAEDRRGDIVSVLRDDVARTTERLAAARHAQERLIADAAHELRTPLTAMRAAIDIALRRKRDHEELEAVLGDLREEVSRLGDLAERLLDMAAIRGAPLERARGDLVDVLRDAVDRARSAAENLDLQLIITLNAPATAPAEFAATAWRQAVDNILDNALKFAPKGSQVDVELTSEGQMWLLRVTDHGPGVDPTVQERIFEPFERANARTPGAGLGLAIVREVAIGHGGWCRVEPRTDGQSGASFVIAIAVEASLTRDTH